jgi:ribonuclease P protein component
VIVPRHGHTAVDRNKLKRRVREIVRLELLPHLPAVDLVIRARATAYEQPFVALATELTDVRTGL